MDTYTKLSKAMSIDEILRVTRDYIGTDAGEELARLPVSCRPTFVNDCADIERWVDQLTSESRRSMLMEDERVLDRVTNHFLIASVRIRQFARQPLQAL